MFFLFLVHFKNHAALLVISQLFCVVHEPYFWFVVFFFYAISRETEGRRRRSRRREGDEAGGGGGDEIEDPVGQEEDGYGAFCSHAQSEEIYHDLCSLHLPPPPSAAQVIIIFFILLSLLFYFVFMPNAKLLHEV